MQKTLLVSLMGAVTGIEKWPGELFALENYDVIGLTYDEFSSPRDFSSWSKKICVLEFTFYRCPDFDLSEFDVVLVSDPEAIDSDSSAYINDLSKKFNNPNVYIITSGYHQQYPIDPNRIFIFPFFLMLVPTKNKILPVQPLTNSTKKFDALLGMKKPNRDFVYQSLKNNNMLDQCLVNYTTNRFETDLSTIYRSPELWQYEEAIIVKQRHETLDPYAYIDNTGPRVSQIVPWKIYDNCLYSIVSETNFSNYIFFSEKTAKALFAKRIFVFFGTQGSLEFLRRWGFRTFDTIIDETYDNTTDDYVRWSQAFEQVKKLCNSDHDAIFRDVHDIVEHNSKHICNRDYFITPLKLWLNKISEKHDLGNIRHC